VAYGVCSNGDTRAHLHDQAHCQHDPESLAVSGMKAADAPSFERYDEKFHSSTGDGGLEMWVPVRE
jgi:hypothetical protein